MTMTPRTKEECQSTAIDIMRQEANAFADECASKWWRGEYADDKADRKVGYQDWKNIKQCISEFCSQLKREIRSKTKG